MKESHKDWSSEHLIKQWLKPVVILSINERNIHRLVRQNLRRVQAADNNGTLFITG